MMNSDISRKEFLAFLTPICVLMIFGFIIPLGLIFYNSIIIDGVLTADGLIEVFMSSLFRRVYLNTLEVSFIASLVAIVVGYPVALYISRQSEGLRAIYMLLVLLPFWTSMLVKSFGFMVILGDYGVINNGLRALGLPHFQMLFNRFAVYVGTTHWLIPFAVFPILANLLSHDQNLRRAAEVMGAGPLRIFWRITFPLSRTGVLAAFILTFVLSLGVFATPELLGGSQDMMIANLIEFYVRDVLNWRAASAIAVILLFTSGALLLLLSRIRSSEKLI